MVFNSLWNIQQWLHCTFKSLLIVKPTGNSPSCVLKSSFPTISLFIQVWTFCVNLSTCSGHCGWLQGYNLSETWNTFALFGVSYVCSRSWLKVRCGGARSPGWEAKGDGIIRWRRRRKSSQPQLNPNKGKPTLHMSLANYRVYSCPQIINVGAKETRVEIQKQSGQWLISLCCLWDRLGSLICRKAYIVLSG